MFKRLFDHALDFYFWETVDPLNVPTQFHPSDENDGFIMCSVPVRHKGKLQRGLRAIQWYDVRQGRFETGFESQDRIVKEREKRYGKMIMMPVYEKEWSEFQDWKEQNEN